MSRGAQGPINTIFPVPAHLPADAWRSGLPHTHPACSCELFSGLLGRVLIYSFFNSNHAECLGFGICSGFQSVYSWL